MKYFQVGTLIFTTSAPPGGYVLLLSERVDPYDRFKPRIVYASDQIGVIYETQVRDDKQPSARELGSAKNFPGAVSFDRFTAEQTGGVVTRFLSSFVVYAQGGCICSCCIASDCNGAWQDCTSQGSFFNCGCLSGCVWCCGCDNWCGPKNEPEPLCSYTF